MKIDAHQHFWRYSPREYAWIDETMGAIRRDFLPAHLEKETSELEIDGVISVQARQTLEETRWLLGLAAKNDFIRGVVGWVPLIGSSVRDELAALRCEQRLRGVRHVVQDESNGYLLREDFNAGVTALEETGLVYDLLVREHQLPETIQFVDRHPNQVFVLDHLAKPRIGDKQPWSQHIQELARREHVFCKVSGLVTEADFQTWTEELLWPYFETVLAAFGAGRLMFGSDWPVCLVASSYRRWYEVVSHFAVSLSADEQANFFGTTAARVYRLAI
jgi:L-fuconolactonase